MRAAPHDADLTQTGFGQVAQLRFEAPGLPDSPATVPVTFTPLHDILRNGGFEQPLAPDRNELLWMPSATFTVDLSVAHSDQSAQRSELAADRRPGGAGGE